MQKQRETRAAKNTEQETRSKGEIRAVNEDGSFEGYLTVWGTVDDYNSTFQRGAFKKTIQERGAKVKILYDHEHLIGSSIELREDDHGVYGCGKLNLSVDKAKEAYEFMKDGTLEGLSFGFRTIKEGFEGGIRQIKEVQLYEFGPVTFPANEQALITGVRSQDFSESLDEETLRKEKYALQNALDETLMDIWWAGDTNSENVIGKLDAALSDFRAAYLDFAGRWVAQFWNGDEIRSTPLDNELSTAFSAHLSSNKTTIDELAANSQFTASELRTLQSGKLIENRGALDSLSPEIKTAHQLQRNKAVESLCQELRSGFSNTEKTRLTALLRPVEERKQSEPEQKASGEMIEFFKNLSSSLGEK